MSCDDVASWEDSIGSDKSIDWEDCSPTFEQCDISRVDLPSDWMENTNGFFFFFFDVCFILTIGVW